MYNFLQYKIKQIFIISKPYTNSVPNTQSKQKHHKKYKLYTDLQVVEINLTTFNYKQNSLIRLFIIPLISVQSVLNYIQLVPIATPVALQTDTY